MIILLITKGVLGDLDKFKVYIFIDELLDSLNGMQHLLTGEDEYDPKFYAELVECLESVDPKLLPSVNAQWKGFKDYAGRGGAPDDEWKRCPPNDTYTVK